MPSVRVILDPNKHSNDFQTFIPFHINVPSFAPNFYVPHQLRSLSPLTPLTNLRYSTIFLARNTHTLSLQINPLLGHFFFLCDRFSVLLSTVQHEQKQRPQFHSCNYIHIFVPLCFCLRWIPIKILALLRVQPNSFFSFLSFSFSKSNICQTFSFTLTNIHTHIKFYLSPNHLCSYC